MSRGSKRLLLSVKTLAVKLATAWQAEAFFGSTATNNHNLNNRLHHTKWHSPYAAVTHADDFMFELVIIRAYDSHVHCIGLRTGSGATQLS